MTRRYTNLGIYRLIAAIAIVHFHICFIIMPRDVYAQEFLLAKAVQGLTALSGFLYARRAITDVRKFLFKAFKKLLIPTACVFGFILLWNIVYFLINPSPDFIAQFLDKRKADGSLLAQPGNFYYIVYILICYIISPLLQKPRVSRIVAISIFAIELLLCYFFDVAIIISAYTAGFYIGKHHFESVTDGRISKRNLLFSLLPFVIATAAFILLDNVALPEGYLLSHLFLMTKSLLSSIAGTASFFLVSIVLKPLNKYAEPKFLIYTDRLSLVLFLFNQTFMCGSMNVSLYVPNLIAGIALVYLFTLSASVAVDFLLNTLPKLIKSKKESAVQSSTPSNATL